MDIEVLSSIAAEAEIKKYTLVSDDIYVKRYDSTTIPDWYSNLINSVISTDPFITGIVADVDYLSGLEAGYNVQFANLIAADTAINSLLTSLSSQTDINTASIANLDVTYATRDYASAISLTTVQSYFNDGAAAAWFDSEISTYASNITANAFNISSISVILDSHSASVTRSDEAVIDTQVANPLWTDDGFQSDPDSFGVSRYITEARAKSSLVVEADGTVAGFVAEADGASSSFSIVADVFKITNGYGDLGVTPFTVDMTNPLDPIIEFIGKTTFDSYLTAGTTTIDGGFITTGTLLAGSIGTEVLYDSSHWDANGNELAGSVYKMKIDMNNGEIHIM